MASVYTYRYLKKILSEERGQRLVKQIKEAYSELFEGKPIERPTYADFMNIFEKNGDTAVCDRIDTLRKRRFFCLQILALDDDRYLGEMEEMLAEFCAQYAWFSSYHHRDDVNQTFDYEQIDLDTAYMSMMVSLTYGVMKDKLRNDIKIRIRREILRRVILPFENNPTYFGLSGKNLSNWVATQLMGTGYAYLYVFPERLPAAREKLFASMDAYLCGFAEDGYCSEGYGYWHAGFGSLAMFLDAFREETGEDITWITNRPKVQSCLAFGSGAVLRGGIGLPFADHQDSHIPPTTNNLSHVVLKRAFGDGARLYDAYDGKVFFVRDQEGTLVPNGIGRSDSGYHRVLALETFAEGGEGGVVKNGTVIFPIGGAFIANRARYSFVAKAGNNDENHNHNDVGTFAFFVDGKRIFPDVRSHKYDAIYFDDRYRYTEQVFAAGSMGHSVPIVDGGYQAYGVNYKGAITDSAENLFEVNLSGAYDTDVTSLKVRYELLEDRVKIRYTMDEPDAHTLKLRFIAGYEPREIDGGFEVGGVQIVSTTGLSGVANRVDYLGHHVDVTAYTLDFDAGSVTCGTFDFEIRL